MSILSVSPQTEIAHRNKINSDIVDALSGDLTIKNNHMSSSHGQAARINRDRVMELEIERLIITEVDSAEWFDKYLESF